MNDFNGNSVGTMHAYVRACVIIALACCSVNRLFSAEFYVSPAGSDSDVGSLARPWRSIQRAVSEVSAGDTVYLRGNAGIYSERVNLTGLQGSASAPITFTTFAGDDLAAIETTISSNESGLIALWTMRDCDYIHLNGLEFRNCKTAGTNAQQRSQLPIGIYVVGAGEGVAIRNCRVHDIWQSSELLNDFGPNGFGVLISGDAPSPIQGVIFENNEVYNLRTGASESVAFNGNVTEFLVRRNTVHSCNNIGIDFIGFEGTNSDVSLDQARFGVCSENVIYDIDSRFNPAYGGNFETGGGNGTRSAPGLYVDGGRDIILERNHVYRCNFAISIGSENTGRLVTNVTVRNNIFNHCHVGGIVMGGAGLANGGASNCSFTNNTLYDNDTVSFGGGQISIQNYISNIVIQRNLLASSAGFVQFILKTSTTGNFGDDAINRNFFWRVNNGFVEFIWNGQATSDFTAWQSLGGVSKSANGFLQSASDVFTGSSLSENSPASDFSLTAGSVLRDIGDSEDDVFLLTADEKDFDGKSRVANGRVDIGAYEYMDAWQLWRDGFFALPDGGLSAEAEDDPDQDGFVNLIEYSQGMNPLVADISLAPKIKEVAGTMRYEYRKAADGLNYQIESNDSLEGVWSDLTSAEVPFGDGIFGHELPPDKNRDFFRLRVSFR